MPKFNKNLYGNNEVLDCGDFFISFNAYPCYGISGFESDNNSSETALIHKKKKPQYLILNGDFRKAYTKLAPRGYEACKEFYNKNIVHRSSWSNDDQEES